MRLGLTKTCTSFQLRHFRKNGWGLTLNQEFSQKRTATLIHITTSFGPVSKKGYVCRSRISLSGMNLDIRNKNVTTIFVPLLLLPRHFKTSKFPSIMVSETTTFVYSKHFAEYLLLIRQGMAIGRRDSLATKIDDSGGYRWVWISCITGCYKLPFSQM